MYDSTWTADPAEPLSGQSMCRIEGAIYRCLRASRLVGVTHYLVLLPAVNKYHALGNTTLGVV